MNEFQPKSLKEAIEGVLYKDRIYLNKLLHKLIYLKKKSPFDAAFFEQQLKRFNRALSQSKTLLEKKYQIKPEFNYPSNLPVCQRKEEILDLLNNNQVVIVAGETGSGKTTQLGKMCLELGRGRLGQIGHTQPRRVAATSVAKRIADELGQELGKAVGYQIRFKDLTEDITLLKVMTDGVLLAEIGRDKWLRNYDTLIIDEAHERSLNIDFLLGYLKQLLPERPDLKVIITSATIDVEKFSRHFNHAPVIEVTGRSFDVQVCYRPLETLSPELDINEAIEQILLEIDVEERACAGVRSASDVLVFLPGENDIRQASQVLRRSHSGQVDVLPLYSRLNQQEHDKIFRPGKQSQRRVILATNVAETSLTVPGIGYVIDSGLARISRYSHRSKVQRLPIEKIAKASAMQRAGRCGRIAKGVCYRLYSEDDFNQRDEFTEPEIQRTNLSQVILQMYALKLGNIEAFDFIQPPEQKLINDGLKQLVDLAALDDRRCLTNIGRSMSQWPLDPKLARMMTAAESFSCVNEMMILVSSLASRDPREYPSDKRQLAKEKHKPFFDAESDFSSLLKLWHTVENQRQTLSSSQFRKYCQKNLLSWQRLKEWRDIHKQLCLIARSIKLPLNSDSAEYDQIHKTLLTGFSTQVGFQYERLLYSGTRNRQFRLFPNSSLHKKPPKWVVVAELLETSQLYGHTAAKIQPEWIIETSAHLLNYQYFEPHFSSKQGRVLVYKKTSLYGLVLEEKKRIGYADIDPVISREIFIREALVEQRMQSKALFYQRNKALRKEVEDLEEKSRNRNLLASDDDIYAFYDSQIPASISTVRALEGWLAKSNDSSRLFADKSLFLKHNLDNVQEDFPGSIEWQGVKYALDYRFQPGKDDDGMCIKLPVTTLNRVPRFLFEWLVPGLLAEKCEAMLRSLPKQYRRPLVPIPATVKEILTLLTPDDKPLTNALCKAIERTCAVKIPDTAFQLDKLDNYYSPLFELRDNKSRILAKSRDLGYLIKTYGHEVKQALDKKVEKAQIKGGKRWVFGKVDKQQQFKQSGTLVTSFPALQDDGDSVRLVLTDYPAMQEKVHRNGLVRLAMLYLPQQAKYLKKHLLQSNHIQLKMTAEFQSEDMKLDLVRAAFNHCFFSNTLPFNQEDFERLLDDHRQNLTIIADGLEEVVLKIMDSDYSVRTLLSQISIKNCEIVKNDISQQRNRLLYPGFIYDTPVTHFKELPRYFNALKLRLERLGNQLSKDLKITEDLTAIRQKLDDLFKEHPESAKLQEVIKLNWMLEEYRVSLFAQQLKTLYPVSQKRIEKQWQLVRDEVRSTFI